MIKRVLLENWRSHKLTELEFERGTNVLVGTMGSGKSSVMNAICFALFGTFPELQRREAKLDDVIMDRPSRADRARVELEFFHNGSLYRVEREIHRGSKTNTAKLYEEGRFLAGPKVSDVNERIEGILELGYELFSRAVYSEQNQMDYFIRLNAGARKQKFDELLELETYERVRKNAVSLSNVLKKLLEEKKHDLEEQRSRLAAGELEELKTKSKEIAARITEKEKEHTEVVKKVKALEEKVSMLKEKAVEFKSLKEKSIAIRQSIESLEADVKKCEEEAGEKLEAIDPKKVSSMKGELLDMEKKLEEKEKLASKLKADASALRARLESLEEENRSIRLRLPERVSSAKELETALEESAVKRKKLEKEKQGMEKKLIELEGKEKELGEKLKVSESRSKKEEETLEKLGVKSPNCPLCRRPLSEKAREQIVREAKKALKDIMEESEKTKRELGKTASEKEKVNAKLAGLEKELSSLSELAAFLKSLKEPLERLEHNLKKSRWEKEKLVALEEKEKELCEEKLALELSKIEKKKKAIEWLENGLEKFQELKAKKEERVRVEGKIKSLEFDEEKALALERLLEKKRGETHSLEIEITGLKELLEEKKKREKEAMEKRELFNKTKARVESLNYGLSKLGLFTSALKATQAELREQLVETINQAMETVWKRLYPYADYVSSKMEISSGDYEIMTKTRSGKWRKIEGLLSGGERSAVALTLRISFSLVLARNLGILILDEPTHNLDSATVEKLGEMMREHLSGLVEQVFLITHNKEMEKAANAALYLFDRNKEREGITRAEMLSIRD